MTVTAYLTGHLGGWYDCQSRPNGGETWSVPEYCVDPDSVRDAPPERLTPDDWAEIGDYVTGRYGAEDGRRILADWRRVTDALDAERGAL